MEETLTEFLKEHKIKLLFETNLKAHRAMTLKQYLKRYNLRKFGLSHLISHAFVFGDSPQGREFWLDINAKWRESVMVPQHG